MHLKLLSSQFAEYRTIKAHSKVLAFVWKLGHVAWGFSALFFMHVLLGFLTVVLDHDPAHAAIRWRFCGKWCGDYGLITVVFFAVGSALKWSATRLDAHG